MLRLGTNRTLNISANATAAPMANRPTIRQSV